jgi:pyridoxal phosphate enzyme (YggS family)
MTTIADRLKLAQYRISQAAQENGRLDASIQLLAVSKTKPVEDIVAAYQAGQRSFGENYVQEGQDKILRMAADYPDIDWHFIGPLQANKSRIIAEHFHWLHTLSRDKIAKRLNDQRPDTMAPLNVCIQVNISGEDSKSGISLDEIPALATVIASCPRLKLRGLMAIPSPSDKAISDNIISDKTASDKSSNGTCEQDQKLIQEFSQLKHAFDKLKQDFVTVDTLSMGMSNDLALAIAHGSTMVRIGSAIFGER